MLKDEMERIRKALDQAIREDKDYSIIYNLSIQLDDLIVSYYRETDLEVS